MADSHDYDSGFLRFLMDFCISPSDAKKQASNARRQAEGRRPGEADHEYSHRVANDAAERIIRRYASLTSVSGGLVGLASIVPGAGLITAAAGLGVADYAVCMKLQADMCLCLAECFGYDVSDEDIRHIALLVAACAALDKFGVGEASRIFGKAGVNVLRQHLKGAALMSVKAAFRQVGVTLSRKSLEKALPLGIGVVVGSGSNFALTRYVGAQGKSWFGHEMASTLA